MARRTTLSRPTRHGTPAAFRDDKGRVLLAFALDRDGRKVDATRLDPKMRRSLAPYRCLGCGEDLVPHLGRVRAPHFAHLPGSLCPLTSPETILHLDVKETLLALCADAFERRRVVRLATRCSSCRRPIFRDLALVGDSAEAEGALGPLRADVLVRTGGKPALAIEVRVTHAIGPQKEAALLTAGVPAVEVNAREDFLCEHDGGIDVRCERSLGFPACPSCAVQERAERDRAAGGERCEIAELESYRAKGLIARDARPGERASENESAGDPPPLSAPERANLERRFLCPECGRKDLEFGLRIARHACPNGPARPIAWRGYDGTLVLLAWWRR